MRGRSGVLRPLDGGRSTSIVPVCGKSPRAPPPPSVPRPDLRWGFFASLLLAAGQVVREAAQALLARETAQWSLVREVAQWSLVLAPLPVALLLRLLGLGLGLPGLLPLRGLLLRFGLSLLGAALGLLGLVPYQGAVGLLEFALRLIHRGLLPCLVGGYPCSVRHTRRLSRYAPTLLSGPQNEFRRTSRGEGRRMPLPSARVRKGKRRPAVEAKAGC